MVSKKDMNEYLSTEDVKIVGKGIRTVSKEIDEKEDKIKVLTRSKAKLDLVFNDEDEKDDQLSRINNLIETNEGLLKNWLYPSLEKLYEKLEGM
jgi:hypothetical protein